MRKLPAGHGVTDCYVTDCYTTGNTQVLCLSLVESSCQKRHLRPDCRGSDQQLKTSTLWRIRVHALCGLVHRSNSLTLLLLHSSHQSLTRVLKDCMSVQQHPSGLAGQRVSCDSTEISYRTVL